MKTRMIFRLVVALFILSINTIVYAWPKVMLPPQSGYEQKLAEEMVVNGVPMQITNFKTRLSVEQVLRFYKNRWSNDFAESNHQEWLQITRYKGNYLITVQVKYADIIDNGFVTDGRLNISDFDDNKKVKLRSFPMLHDSKIINDIETRDKGKLGRTLLFLNRQSSDDNADFYKKHYTQNNWRQVMAQQLGNKGRVYIFKKKDDEVTINIHSIDGGSSVLVNEVLKKTWFN